MVHLNIDGQTVDALPGQTVLEAALEAGIYIPHLCAHPDLSASGGCKLCTVEVDGHDKPVQSCEITVTEGMVVRTSTTAAEHVRSVALELVLASHPKDCTTCAAYLNCELQALMQYTGVTHSRLREIDKKNDGVGQSDSIFKKEMYRCIQCTRCVRACDEMRGVGVLQLQQRNGETFVGTKDDVPMTETDCRFCSACVAVCPTGAIMDAPGLFAKDVPRTSAQVPCQNNCPARTDIPLYLKLAGEGRYSDSVAVFREKLTLPLALGYVCNHPCESDCKRGKLDFPISIREVKRFAVENDTEQSWREKSTVAPSTGKRVAVVGAGPAGLTGAYYLSRKGHSVTVLERLPKPGGMMTYGIPKYRLPQHVVDWEIGILTDDAPFTVETGVDVTDVGELKDSGYDAVLVAAGAQAGRRPPAYQGSWTNAYDAVDLCRRWNLGETPQLGDSVSVIGGGNVAFDCARSARKLGASTVRILCLEPLDKMLADREELREARAEGIEIVNSVSVVSMEADDDRLTALTLARVKEFGFTAAGLRLELEDGSEFDQPIDSVIFAAGQMTDLTSDFGVELGRGGFVTAGTDAATSLDGVFAAGDVVTGTKTVIEAIAGARNAASAIDRFLGGNGDIEDTFFEREDHDPELGVIPDFANLKRTDCRTEEAIRCETSRCLHCELRQDIDTVKYWTDAAYQNPKGVK
ncbi:FAD-dependent oxidoreductase [Streptomyces sp. YIM S03343]